MNLLAKETSPYLRQHADNPVHWRPWGKAAFEEAQARNTPVLLSIGYAACHWCHVMAHESFEDKTVADIMNAHFVCIKVDREERPDIDAVYQNAAALMGVQGGWPLTMFLTPAGAPFWGGTYFPPHARFGLPSFQDVLAGVRDGYTAEGDKIAHNAKNVTAALHALQAHTQGISLTRETIDTAARKLLEMTDKTHGGFGHAPKFPSTPALSLLWRAYLRTQNAAFKDAVMQALTQMCQGGIYDHLGGGFCRYAVDDAWLVPHFEKMLCDNALLLSLLSDVVRETKNPLLEERLREIAAWMTRDMAVAHGGLSAFASSLDADSLSAHGHAQEGAYYTWRADEIDAALGAEAAVFKDAYDVSSFGNWEGVNILNRLKSAAPFALQDADKMRALRKKLLAARALRPPPARDDKVLADWNGLAIAGLCKAAFALDEPALLAPARAAFEFVTRFMTNGATVLHSWCAGSARHAAMLEDFANMAHAALCLFEATGEDAYVRHAANWADAVLRDYQDDAHGGFFMTAHTPSADDAPLPLRPKSAYDAAVPNGNATMIGVLSRLHLITQDARYFEAAARAVNAFSGGAAEEYFPLSTFLNNGYALGAPWHIAIAGDDRARLAFLNVVRDMSLPDALIVHSGSVQPPQGSAVLCVGTRCLPPVFDTESFRTMLMEERARERHAAAND